jgi:hypothetical protein
MKFSIALTLLAASAAWAADPTPLDLKTGEWEYTVTMQMTGMAQPAAGKQMPQLTPDQLARIPADQRAKVEAMMKQGSDIAAGKPTTTTNKNCVKKEDLAKLNPMRNDDKSCKMTVLNSSRGKLEAKVDCDSPENKTTSTVTVESLSSESSKFNVVSNGTSNGRPISMNINGTGKWLGATCTDAK